MILHNIPNTTSFFDSINAIGTFSMAVIALISLCLNFYLLYDQIKQRQEEKRAKLIFSIVEMRDMYFLKVTNIGKEIATNISLIVSGTPIDQNINSFIQNVYSILRSRTINIEFGASNYFPISPVERNKGTSGIEGCERHSAQEYLNWLENVDDTPIIINCVYHSAYRNKEYKVLESFSIRDFLVRGSFIVNDAATTALEKIANAIGSNNPEDSTIQSSIQSIEKSFKNKENGKT